MLILGIESSCDETGAALYHRRRGLLGHRLHSQVALHADYGGVVPELASRDHVRKLPALVSELLAAHGFAPGALDAVAHTEGPGLVGALLVGSAFARGLAYAIDRPVIGVHHMEAHLLAPLLEPAPPAFPFVALLVSGGHSMLVEVAGIGRYRLVGDTRDDAAGEAFDKTAKLLGLPYPGGPALARLAAGGDASRFEFPRPMVDRPGLDLSFSGLKTHTARLVESTRGEPGVRADVAAGFQHAVVETLVLKCRRALRQSGFRRLVVAGGVGANERLRERLREAAAEDGWQAFFPRLEFCTDNAAMIAFAGAQRLAGAGRGPGPISARPRWPLDTLPPPPASHPCAPAARRAAD